MEDWERGRQDTSQTFALRNTQQDLDTAQVYQEVYGSLQVITDVSQL